MMKITHREGNRCAVARYALAVLLLLSCHVQAASEPDVPYVPTPMTVVDAMLGLGGVGPGDFLIDLGSGDGRISIRAAVRFGTRGMGVDLDDGLVQSARAEAKKRGVQDKVVFEARDLFNTDLSRATVITAYLLNSVNLRLRPQLFAQLRPGTRIVSHDFNFGDWTPDQSKTIDVPDKVYGPPTSDIMLWVVPADFSGDWQWSLPDAQGGARHVASVAQKFQVLNGMVLVQGQRLPLREARVKGDTVSFMVAGQRYSGRISGNTITGEVALRSGEPPVEWRALRVKPGKMDIGSGNINATDNGATVARRVAGNSIKER